MFFKCSDLISYLAFFHVGIQSKTAVGRPISTPTTNTGNPQKYVLMSQRPVSTPQVNFFFYLTVLFIFLSFFLFQNSANKTIYISQQNIKSEFQDPNN